MFQIKRHIALILLGIFFIPIFIQSIHFGWHSHRNMCGSAYCCGITTDGHSSHNKVQFSIQRLHCPICEFHFFFNRLPDSVICESVTPIFCGYLQTMVVDKPYQFTDTLISPRAPPV